VNGTDGRLVDRRWGQLRERFQGCQETANEWADVVHTAGQPFNSGRLELELLGSGEFITAIRKKSSSGDGFAASQWSGQCNDN
jgi:hypothetical protein